ncbi:MAG TPA: carboxylesterase family protein [Steroidobacteraceae bacterium]|nr:carboxylesterase family protein [Steroidobacteraceae bacterium]
MNRIRSVPRIRTAGAVRRVPFALGMLYPALAALLLASTAGARAATAAASLEARVDGGTIRGAIEHSVIAFKGIPFAAPPVGALRWAPPQPVKPWTGVRPAMHFGPDCAQLPTPGDMAPLRTVSKEDCLYLNVWRPRAASARALPVMVWIYGGGFVDGGSSPAVYDGTEFARDGVVLVSFNYRLGNFGLFAFPELSRQAAGGLLGNYTLMDQIAALQWVRRNAAAFGGDPRNVTIFGESAGGMSVNALLMSPLARGLFAKAIIESGAGSDNMYPLRPLAGSAQSAQAMGLRLARHLGVAGAGAGALARLRALPAARLVNGLNLASMSSDQTYVGGPIVDGRLYLGAPTHVYAAGGGARVPVMIGANTDEIGELKATSLGALWRSFGPDAAAARRVYDPDGRRTLQEVSTAAGGDQVMLEPARAIARLLSARGQRVYEYRFGYVASSLRNSLSGAPHASEIPFVFDTVAARYGKSTSRADEAMARAVHAYWVAFARTGRPDPRGEPAWPEYHRSSDVLMSFTDHGPGAEVDPWKRRLDLAARAAERRAH